MGLDGVEIIMEVEEEFGCRIVDAAACEMRTVGDLYDYLLQANAAKPTVAEASARVCPSATTFYKLRRGLMARVGRGRREIRPATRLEDILPRPARRSLWRDLSVDLQLEFPKLAQREWLVSCYQLAALLFAVAIMVITIAIPFSFSVAIFAGIVAFSIAYGLLAHLAEPWAINLQPSFATVGGLTHVLLERNYDALCRAQNNWDEETTWRKLRGIIVTQLGVKPEQVTREASWVELGCD